MGGRLDQGLRMRAGEGRTPAQTAFCAACVVVHVILGSIAAFIPVMVQNSNTGPFVEGERVIGIGPGLLIALVLLIFCCLLCFLTSGTKYAGPICLCSFFSLTVSYLLLFLSPRALPAALAAQEPEQSYDYTKLTRGFVATYIILGNISGAFLVFVNYCVKPQVVARPISYRRDVLMARN